MTTLDPVEPSNQLGHAVIPPVAEPKTRDVSVRALLAPVHNGFRGLAQDHGEFRRAAGVGKVREPGALTRLGMVSRCHGTVQRGMSVDFSIARRVFVHG